ncbi:MAG: alpha/beta hydrolase [Acidobacteriota bacterium]
MRSLLPLAAALLPLTGCVSLTPFAQVREHVPAEDMLEIVGQTVHIEQLGAGEPVVLLHGFGESTYTYRYVMPALAARYRVVAIDLNGFGYTERPRSATAYTLDGQQRMVLGVLDHLGIESAHFVGHSYGGGLTQWIAAHHVERVRSMILVDTTIPLYSTTRRSRVANFRLLSKVFLRAVALRQRFVQRGLRAAYFDPALATTEVANAYLDRLRVEGLEEAYYGLTAKNGLPPAEIDFAAVRVPALVVWGENDTLTSISNGKRIAAALGNARFVSFADCGHVPMEEKPHELLAVMLPFLDAHAGGQARR